MKSILKSFMFCVFVIVTIIIIGSVQVKASENIHVSKRDSKAIEEFVLKKYGEKYRIKYASCGSIDNELRDRKGKKIVYVEQMKTKSKGIYGVIISEKCKGYLLKYISKHKYNEKINVYLIYNPKSNSYERFDFYEKGKIKK